MFCRKCGEVIPDDSMFCPKCGEKIAGEDFAVPKVNLDKASERNCPKCGKGLAMSLKTCIYCGAINPYYTAPSTSTEKSASKPKTASGKPSELKCPKCGKTLTMSSKKTCVYCGAINPYYADLSSGTESGASRSDAYKTLTNTQVGTTQQNNKKEKSEFYMFVKRSSAAARVTLAVSMILWLIFLYSYKNEAHPSDSSVDYMLFGTWICGTLFFGAAAWRIICAFIIFSQEEDEIGVMIFVTFGIIILGVIIGFIFSSFVAGLAIFALALFAYCERKLEGFEE